MENAPREQRVTDVPMTAVAHADVNSVGHAQGTYSAAQYYLSQNKKRRDELMAAAAAAQEQIWVILTFGKLRLTPIYLLFDGNLACWPQDMIA